MSHYLTLYLFLSVPYTLSLSSSHYLSGKTPMCTSMHASTTGSMHSFTTTPFHFQVSSKLMPHLAKSCGFLLIWLLSIVGSLSSVWVVLRLSLHKNLWSHNRSQLVDCTGWLRCSNQNRGYPILME